MIKDFSKTLPNGQIRYKSYKSDDGRNFEFKWDTSQSVKPWVIARSKKSWADVDVWAKTYGYIEISCQSQTQVNPVLVPAQAPTSPFEIQEYFNNKTNDFISYRKDVNGHFTSREGRATMDNKNFWRSGALLGWDKIDKHLAVAGFKPIMQAGTMAAMQGRYSAIYMPRKALKDYPPEFEITIKEPPKAVRGTHKCTCPPEFTSLLWGTGCKCGGV